MPLDRTEKEKLYIRLTEILMKKIRSGEWKAGRQIPTEEDLCREFDVSKITVRRAVDNLALEGYLRKVQGKGTFAMAWDATGGLSMKTTLAEGVFLPGEAGDIRVMEKKVLTLLDDETMRRMGPVIDNEMFYLRRLKSMDGSPVLVNETYVPLRVCPGIADWDADDGSVFEYLRENAPARIARVIQTVEMGKPGEQVAENLKVKLSSPCIVIHRLFLASNETTVGYSKTTARTDRFRLVTEFERVS